MVEGEMVELLSSLACDVSGLEPIAASLEEARL